MRRSLRWLTVSLALVGFVALVASGCGTKNTKDMKHDPPGKASPGAASPAAK